MPTQEEYAERTFSGGLGKRAAFGHCADCGDALLDITDLVCNGCRKNPKNANPEFREREAGHRDRIIQYSGAIWSLPLNPPKKRKAAKAA